MRSSLPRSRPRDAGGDGRAENPPSPFLAFNNLSLAAEMSLSKAKAAYPSRDQEGGPLSGWFVAGALMLIRRTCSFGAGKRASVNPSPAIGAKAIASVSLGIDDPKLGLKGKSRAQE